MAAIESREGLRAWFVGKNKRVILTIASRIVLRGAPLCAARIVDLPEENASTLILPMFRALSATWFIAMWPGREKDIRASVTAAAAHAHAAAHTETDDTSPGASTYGVASSAHVAAYAAAAIAVAANPDTTSDTAAVYASGAATAYADAVTDSGRIWAENSADVAAIQQGLSASELLSRPLWSGPVPRWAREGWAGGRRVLAARDKDWQVWADWYDDRLEGFDDPASRSLIEELEYRRIMIPDADWHKGSQHINGIIAGLEAEFRPEAPPELEPEPVPEGEAEPVPSA